MTSADNQQERFPNNTEFLKYYLTGFADGEGSFSITIHRKEGTRFGWVIDPIFQVYQHKDNSKVLYLFQDVLGCGYVSKKGGNPSCYVFCVDKISHLVDFVIPFFEQHQLIGDKYFNFVKFREVVLGLMNKKHFSEEGFLDLIKICFTMNRNGYYRKNKFEDIVKSLEKSSETIRQSTLNG